MTAGVLLAAGESTRMGQLKALLPWRGTTLLESQLREMLAAGLAPLIVVLGHRADELEPLVGAMSLPPRREGKGAARSVPLPSSAAADERLGEGTLHVVINERYREGKSTSIVTGVAALRPGTEAALLVAVDQPTEAPILQALLARHVESRAPIVLPSFEHRRGHPTLFAAAVFPELLAITEEREGLREVMTRHNDAIAYVDVASDIVRANLNSPDDYQAAYARWGAS